MINKSILTLTILALIVFSTCTSWGYTVSQWPPAGIPNTVYGPGAASLGNTGFNPVMPGNVGHGGAGYGGYPAQGYGYPGAYGGPGGNYYGQGWGR